MPVTGVQTCALPIYVLITKGDLENGLENLEVCLSGFPLSDRVEDKPSLE
jgi:hypothetical protein